MNLQLSRSSDYAVRLMVHLASQVDGRPVPQADIASSQQIPEAYLQKLLAALSKAGLVTGRRGPGGGFVLTQEPWRVSLLDVIEAVDGPVALNVCVMRGEGCDRLARCPVHRVWRIAQRQLIALLEETTLRELAAEGNAIAQTALGCGAAFGCPVPE